MILTHSILMNASWKLQAGHSIWTIYWYQSSKMRYLHIQNTRYKFWNVICSREIEFNASKQVALLDYDVEVSQLPESIKQLCFDGSGCFSVGGFEMRLSRKAKKYVNNYFVPSGLLVVISWVSKQLLQITIIIMNSNYFMVLLQIDKLCYSPRSCSW